MAVKSRFVDVEVEAPREAVYRESWEVMLPAREAVYGWSRTQVEPARPAKYERRYDLKMGEEEARTLADVLVAVGGCPHSSRRRHTAAILLALAHLGVYPRPGAGGTKGPTYFEEEI